MLGVINDNIEVLLEEFDKQLRRVIKSRILPMSTQEFSNCLHKAKMMKQMKKFIYVPTIKLEMIGPNNNTSELVSGIVNEIIKKFSDTKECYIFTGKAGVYLNGNEFGKSIMETFENGTIIAMYVTMDGDIYLDDKKIGYLYELEAKSDESMKLSGSEINMVTHITADGNIYIYDEKKWCLRNIGDKSGESTECPKQISKDQVIQMIKDHFVNKIDNYTISNGG